MRRVFTLFSVACHAVIVTVLLVAQVLAVGKLPVPRHPLFYDNVRRVTLTDIRLPAPPRRAVDQRAGSTVSENAAPTLAPTAIAPETGREGVPTSRSIETAVEGRGSGLDTIIGTGAPLPPPPAPLPPAAPVRLHSGMTAPRKIVDVTPMYPALARSARVEGVVILEAVIDAQGRVESVRVLRSIGPLDQAAVDAVRQWRFTPAQLSGEAVPVVMTVTVNFMLQGR